MNDLSRMQCSEEVTVLGILRVVEEILERRPDSRVVINSLLPMAYSRGGQYALLHDYQDSLGEMGNTKRDRVKNDPASDTAPANDEKDGWRRSLRSNRTRTNSAPDDDTAEETRLETEQRQKEGKRKRGKENVVLDAEAHKAHKYNFLTGLLTHRAKSPPLWTAVYAINRELQAFADKNDNVDFFDATPVFASKLPKGKFELHSAKISARGHPTPAGFRDWEDAIVVRLNSILTVMKQQKPELFSVLDQVTDDDAGLPNRTDHPGFGFDEDEAPDMGIRPYADDFFANEEGDGKGEGEPADQPDTLAEGSVAEGNGEVQSQPANDGGEEDSLHGDRPKDEGDGEDSGAQESPDPDGGGDSQEKEPADAEHDAAADPAPASDEAQPEAAPASTGDEPQPETAPESTGDEPQPETAPASTAGEAQPETAPESTGDEAQPEAAPESKGDEPQPETTPESAGEPQPETTPESAGDEAQPETAPVDGATPETDQQPAASDPTTGGSDGSPASEAEGQPSTDASTEGNGTEPEGNGENAGDSSEATAPEGDPSPPQEETPQE
jgi:hypothetical protein